MATETVDRLKMDLIVEITNLNDKKSLRQIKDKINDVKKRPSEIQLEMLNRFVKPIREKTDITEIIKEQNWKPSSKKDIEEIIKDFDWQISDEEFIELLKNI